MTGPALLKPPEVAGTAPVREPSQASLPSLGWFRTLTASRLRKLGYSSADQALAVGGMFIVNIALARTCSKEEYGIFALSYSVFTFLAGLHNAAILEAYTIYGSGRYRGNFQKYGRLLWQTNAWLATGLSVLLPLVWLGLRWLYPALASPALLGMGLTCGVLLTAAFVRRTFYIRHRPGLALRFSSVFFASCLALVALSTCSSLLNGMSAFVVVALAWMIAILSVARDHPLRIGTRDASDFLLGEPGYWREHWNYCRWVLLTALVFQFTAQAYFWVVAGVLSVKDVARLRALYNLVLPVDQGFAAITLVVLPRMALLFAAGESGKLRAMWRQCSLAFLALSSLFALVVGGASLPLMHAVYGGKFDEVAPLLRWYVLLPVVMGVGNAANAALKAMERPKAVFCAYLASGATTFLVGIPLVMHLGLRGAVYGMLWSGASYAFVLALSFYRLSRPAQLASLAEAQTE